MLQLILSAICLFPIAPEPKYSAQVMGTTIRMTRPNQCQLREEHLRYDKAEQEVLRLFHEVDQKLSEWKEGSPITKINAQAGIGAVELPEFVFKSVEQAIQVASMTGGAFDPTWASLWHLWDFNTQQLPSKEEVQSLLHLVNWNHVELNDESRTVRLKQPGMLIGLGGIGKGIALEESKKVLVDMKIDDYLIVAGGQVLARGLNLGKPWRVGIQKPDKPFELVGVLNVTDTCVSTSGDYEKYFEKDGVRYHHIIDPRTGFPARGIRSVTVITPDATLADALSTALFVMGREKAMDFVNSIPEVEVVIVDESGDVFQSKPMLTEVDTSIW